MALTSVRDGIAYLPHQEIGIRWMLEREDADAAVCRGGILADDMGLGKTFQTIGLLKNSPFAGFKTLIICPPALMAGWTEELRACGYTVSVLFRAASWTREPLAQMGAEAEAEAEAEAIVWLTSYPKAHLYRQTIAAAGFQRVVLDEGHVIRNGKATSRWLACMAIASRSLCRWILSATPVQNSGVDWYNLCWWLHVRSKKSAIPGLGSTIMLRRTMSELRDTIEALPPPGYFHLHDLQIPEGGEEGILFRNLTNALLHAEESKTTGALIKLELYMRIQQFLVHPQVYIESMRNKFGGGYRRDDWAPESGNTKWTACMTELHRSIADCVGTIVFCNFCHEMNMVAQAAEEAGATVFSIRGGMGSDKVGLAVSGAREAVAAGSPVVVVVQIVSGGAGLNLQFCSKILFLSQHWNPAVVHQAIGRAVRIGQDERVHIHLFRVVDDVLDNIDRRMVQVHIGKIAGAQKIAGSLYEGFAPLKEIPTARGVGFGPGPLPEPLPLPSDEEDEEPGDPSD